MSSIFTSSSVSRKAARISRVALFAATLVASSQAAAMFSDDEARRAILELRSRVDTLTAKIESIERQIPQSQIQLLNEIERQRAEIARLRGQIEEFGQLAGPGNTAVQDLARRLSQLEPVSVIVDQVEYQVTPLEKADFETAQSLLASGDFQRGAQAFGRFTQRHPGSPLYDLALFSKGSAFYALKDYRMAIFYREEFLSRFPAHSRAPQAMLNLAASQAELGNRAAARVALEGLIDRYPKSPLIEDAKKRLKDLPRVASPTK
jgi:tol-pal system protein YbgF